MSILDQAIALMCGQHPILGIKSPLRFLSLYDLQRIIYYFYLELILPQIISKYYPLYRCLPNRDITEDMIKLKKLYNKETLSTFCRARLKAFIGSEHELICFLRQPCEMIKCQICDNTSYNLGWKGVDMRNSICIQCGGTPLLYCSIRLHNIPPWIDLDHQLPTIDQTDNEGSPIDQEGITFILGRRTKKLRVEK
jgi:hypothetical protein